jgi:hypothetical protein
MMDNTSASTEDVAVDNSTALTVVDEQVDATGTTLVVPATDTSPAATISVPIPVATDFVVVARNSTEMAQAQVKLLAHMDARVAAEGEALKEAKDKLDFAVKAHHARASFAREVKLREGNILFYRKIRAALELGYCIVPNFPVELIAIRTNDVAPDYAEESDRWSSSFDVSVKSLPVGEGRYVGPKIAIKSELRPTGEADKKKRVHCTKDFREIVFPARLAKMAVLEDLGRAEKAKVFDAIGILPKPQRNPPDPMLIGQIVQKTGTYSHKTVSFMIAWWIDTASL